MVYRFTLESISCQHERGTDRYRDAVAVESAAFLVRWDESLS